MASVRLTVCKECKFRKPSGGRGLCTYCYSLPEIRKKYLCLDLFQDPSYELKSLRTNYKRRLGEPTKALPGTPEKVQVLIRRAELGLILFHPLDARTNEDDLDVSQGCLSGNGGGLSIFEDPRKSRGG